MRIFHLLVHSSARSDPAARNLELSLDTTDQALELSPAASQSMKHQETVIRGEVGTQTQELSSEMRTSKARS